MKIVLTKEQFIHLKNAFISQGTSYYAWCKQHNVTSSNAKSALLGEWSGSIAQGLVKKAIKDSKLKLDKNNTVHQQALDNVMAILRGLTINDAEYVLKTAAKSLSKSFDLNGVIKFPAKSKIQRDLPLLNFILSLDLNYLAQKRRT